MCPRENGYQLASHPGPRGEHFLHPFGTGLSEKSHRLVRGPDLELLDTAYYLPVWTPEGERGSFAA